jgi:hypothetical protein
MNNTYPVVKQISGSEPNRLHLKIKRLSKQSHGKHGGTAQPVEHPLGLAAELAN